MPNFCTYTEYLFPHDQSRMRKMQSGERIMRISLSALLLTIVRGQTEKRWSNFKPSKMAGKRTNKQHGRCYTAVMYPVVPNTSYPSERTQPWKRWSNKMAANRTNNMGAAALPWHIQSYQTPVTPVRGHGREGGGAILSRVRWLSTEQTTWEVLHGRHVSGRTKHQLPQWEDTAVKEVEQF